jgi:hypothetical protein
MGSGSIEITLKLCSGRSSTECWDVLADGEAIGSVTDGRRSYRWVAAGSHGSGISLYDCEVQIRTLIARAGEGR